MSKQVFLKVMRDPVSWVWALGTGMFAAYWVLTDTPIREGDWILIGVASCTLALWLGIRTLTAIDAVKEQRAEKVREEHGPS